MRILFQMRNDMVVYSGGERTVATESMRALADLGVDVAMSGQLRTPLDECDVVHLFGLSQPTEPLIQARSAKASGVPVVLGASHCDFQQVQPGGAVRGGQARVSPLAIARHFRVDGAGGASATCRQPAR